MNDIHSWGIFVKCVTLGNTVYIAKTNFVLNFTEEYFELPKGVYIFDFSSGGNITNYGGTRDYIDTEKLTEFWIRTTTTTTGSVKVVSECLARLH